MLIEVMSDGADPRRGTVQFKGRAVPCALGRAGITAGKREGDGATPAGLFPLRRVLYRADRGAAPTTALPVAVIEKDDGWCDAPAHADYNRPVRLPHPAHVEHLWRDDAIYDVIVVIGHNDDPVVPGAGSAVFVHIARHGFAPTAGCIALARHDLLDLLKTAAPGDDIRIGPAA